MRRNWLHSLLILLLALQSVMAKVDLHPVDQIGTANSELGYQLNDSCVSSEKNTTNQNAASTVFSCNDCSNGYCFCYPALSTINLNISFDGAEQLIVDYESSMFEISRSLFLRPPKI